MKDIILRVITVSILILWFGFLAHLLSQKTIKDEIERVDLQIKKEQLRQLRENVNKMIELEGESDDVLRESN